MSSFTRYVRDRSNYEYSRFFNARAKRFWMALAVPVVLGGTGGYHVNDTGIEHVRDAGAMTADVKQAVDSRMEELRAQKSAYDGLRRQVHNAQFDGGEPTPALTRSLYEARQEYQFTTRMTADYLISEPGMTEQDLSVYFSEWARAGYAYPDDHNNRYANVNALKECQGQFTAQAGNENRRISNIRSCMIDAREEPGLASRIVTTGFLGFMGGFLGLGLMLSYGEERRRKGLSKNIKPRRSDYKPKGN